MIWGYLPWPCEPHLETCMDMISGICTDDEMAEIISDLQTGHCQLWVAKECDIIATCVTRRDGDTLEVWKCCGKIMPFVLDYIDFMVSSAPWAKRIRLGGRRGWRRFLGNHGWHWDGEFMYKELKHG